MIIKTACSSAGLSLHLALQAIQQGDISSAIVCGTNLILAPGMTISMSLQMALSPEGSSKTFDASADGYARGEGVTALYIKRLDDAIKDKNPIRAVIRSSASNADGRTNGMAMPNPEAHKAVICQAYRSAGLDMSETAWWKLTAQAQRSVIRSRSKQLQIASETMVCTLEQYVASHYRLGSMLMEGRLSQIWAIAKGLLL